MKPLTKHLKQLRSRNRIRDWADDEVYFIWRRVADASNKRWDAMQADLRLQPLQFAKEYQRFAIQNKIR